MSLKSDIAKIKVQEDALHFVHFNESTAWELGTRMRKAAAELKLPLVIDIRVGTRQLFCTALPGTVPDNAEWIRRKANTVLRFQRSSYLMGREALEKGHGFDASRGLSELDYADAGGGFPIHVEGTGVIGAIIVSGIPQRDDHGFVVEQVALFLGQDAKALALGAEED